MPAKSNRFKDSELKQSLDMDLEIEPMDQQANKQQNKDVEMDDGLNLDNNLNDGLNSDMDVEQNGDANLDLANGTETTVDKKSKPKHGKQGVCVKCNKTKTIYSWSMCSVCYKKHLKAKHKQEGREEAKCLIICLKCNSSKKHYARNLCRYCYEILRKDSEKLKQYPKTIIKSCKGQQGVCVKCNEQTKLYQCSMCGNCYEKERREKRKAGAQKCGNCGKLRFLETNGFCSDCNSDERIKKMAIDQKLGKILKSIEENELIASANLTVHVSLAANAKCFEKFGKIKIDFSEFGDLSRLNSAGLEDNDKSSGPSKYSVSNEDFVNRLKQYASSKLKPLKKHVKSLNKKNASSIFETEKEKPTKSSPKEKKSSKIKSPSKPMKVSLKECIDCKQMKPKYARDRCSSCYQNFMKQKKKEDAEKAKEKSSQDVEAQNTIHDQAKAPPEKPKKKRAKKQSSDA